MCPYSVGFECVECKFCTKYSHNGHKIIKHNEVKEWLQSQK